MAEPRFGTERLSNPPTDRLERDCWDVGVTLRAMRTDEFQQFLRAALDAPA